MTSPNPAGERKRSCVHIDGSPELIECMKIAGDQIHYCPVCGFYLHHNTPLFRFAYDQKDSTIQALREEVERLKGIFLSYNMELEDGMKSVPEMEEELQSLRAENERLKKKNDEDDTEFSDLRIAFEKSEIDLQSLRTENNSLRKLIME